MRATAAFAVVFTFLTLPARAQDAPRPEKCYPLPATGRVSDPLVQAMTLTAIVITFGVTALLLTLIYRVYTAHATLDTDVLAEAEEQEEISAEIDAGEEGPEDDAAILREEAQVL